MKLLILIIVFILLVFLYFLKYNKSFFINFNNKIIKGASSFLNSEKINDVSNEYILKDSKINIGSKLNQNFISYDTLFKLILNNNLYLNIGVTCPKIISENKCLINKDDKNANQLVYYNNPNIDLDGDVDSTLNTSLWTFDEVNSINSKYVYYGTEIFIRSMNNYGGYICICNDVYESNNCLKNVELFSFSDMNEAIENGKWMIIPIPIDDINTNELLDENNNEILFDFYENANKNIYDFSKLRNLKIPVSKDHEFHIINSKKINDRYVYLNICKESNVISGCKILDNNEKIDSLPLATGVIASDDMDNQLILSKDINQDYFGDQLLYDPNSNNFTSENLNKKINEIKKYNLLDHKVIDLPTFKIKLLTYDINIEDTLFVEGSLELGYPPNNVSITPETLRRIKRIPYFFNNEFCLNNDDNTEKVCVKKHHLEILNGDRPLNLESTPSLKPFILYSQANFQGRELRIGYNYKNNNDLPFIKYRNSWINPGDDGKWFSLRIEGNNKAMIFNKPDFGYDPNNENTELANLAFEQEIQKLIKEEQAKSSEENNSTGPVNNNNSNNNASYEYNFNINNLFNYEKTSDLFYFVKSPGIKDVRELGRKWKNGIRSIRFFKQVVGKDYYGPQCLNYTEFSYNKSKSRKSQSKNYNESLFEGSECKNGEKSQEFYLYNDDEIATHAETDEDHIHFHKHMYND